jgi:hypothetical protein
MLSELGKFDGQWRNHPKMGCEFGMTKTLALDPVMDQDVSRAE